MRFPVFASFVTEAGVSWSAPLAWSLDSAWELLRDDRHRSTGGRLRLFVSMSGSRPSRSKSQTTQRVRAGRPARGS